MERDTLLTDFLAINYRLLHLHIKIQELTESEVTASTANLAEAYCSRSEIAQSEEPTGLKGNPIVFDVFDGCTTATEAQTEPCISLFQT